jgi:hypothetical protein
MGIAALIISAVCRKIAKNRRRKKGENAAKGTENNPGSDHN